MKDYIEDIAAGVGLLILAVGIWVEFSLGWALIVLGAGLFGVSIFVSMKADNATAPTQDDAT